MISGLSPRWGRRWFASVAFLVFCQAFRVLGARLDASLPPVPPPDHIEVGVLREAAWAAIACGADYLRTLAATNYQGLVVEPSVKRWVRKAYTRRYREETYDHPIYEEKWEYEEVLVPKQGSMGEHRELVKIRRPIPGSVKRVLVGTEKRTRLVDDPNGPIVREYPEEIHPEVWQRTFLGQNAMALYAMRRAGIPEEDPVVSRLADFLNDALNRFALPDLTWDVAWLTAAFSHLRGERFRQNRDALVRKLLGGQIVDGPSRGLWGSVCIDLPLLSAMVPYEQELAKELKKREAMLAEKPDSKTLQKRVKEADGALADFIRLYREVTQHGLRFEDCMTHWRVPESISADPLVICGLPYHALREAVADLENTALALYALRVAAEQGCLPESLERPKTPVGAPILPPEKVSAILARTMSALAGLQNRDGNFAEGNIHQPITRMEPLGLGQLKKDEVLKLPSPVTDLATVQGAAAVFDIGYLVGVDKILGRYRAVAVGGQAARRSVCTSFLTATNDVPFGRHTSPYDLVFACRGVDLAADGVIVDRRDLFHSVAVRLLKMQDTNGSWGRGLALWQSSAQFWYEDEKICKPAHEKEQASLPKEKRVPYDSKRAWTRRYIYAGRHVDSMDLPVVATCYAMLFLEDGLKRLGTGYIVGTNSVTPPKLLDAALYHLKQRDNMACQVCPVTTNTPLSTVRELPLLFADTRLDWDSAVAKSVFRSYTSGPGMVAFELTDIAKGPVVETKLGLLQPDGKFGDVKEGEEFISGYQGTRPRLRGFFGADGKLRVVLLPPNEVQTAYLLLKYRLSACRSEGAASLIASPDKSTKRVMLLQRLDEFAKASSLRVSGLEQKAAAPSATPAPPPTSDSQPPAAVPPTPAPRPETKPEDLKLPAPPVSEPRKPAEDEMW